EGLLVFSPAPCGAKSPRPPELVPSNRVVTNRRSHQLTPDRTHVRSAVQHLRTERSKVLAGPSAPPASPLCASTLRLRSTTTPLRSLRFAHRSVVAGLALDWLHRWALRRFDFAQRPLRSAASAS